MEECFLDVAGCAFPWFQKQTVCSPDVAGPTSGGCLMGGGATARVRRVRDGALISQKVFMTSSSKTQLPYKLVSLSVIIANIKII